MITSNVATITLSGSETAVEFAGGYPYYFITNKSGSDMYASLSPNIIPEAEGIYTIPAGGTERIGAGYQLKKFYIKGTGKAYIQGSTIAMPPSFKRGGKGGGENAGSNILPHSEGLAAYFDYSQNVTDTSWTDIVSGLTINGDIESNDDFVTTLTDNIINLSLSNAFTVYTIFKFIDNDNNWRSVIGEYDTPPQFNLSVRNKCIAIGTGSSYGQYTSVISALDYNIATLTYLNGMGILYIDGKSVYFYNAYHSPISSNYYLSNGNAYKMAAFFDNVAQSPDFIAENTRYLAEKYGIEI